MKYIYFGTQAVIVRNTIALQLSGALDIIEEVENATDQSLT